MKGGRERWRGKFTTAGAVGGNNCLKKVSDVELAVQ